jgi:succinate-semialdehyde dehydrogenase/glutarate-semialdehyde dehydrogenase
VRAGAFVRHAGSMVFISASGPRASTSAVDRGLVGYVFAQDVDRAFDLSERLEVGMVGVNTGIVSNPAAPFGWVKQSGLGREGGKIGIDEFLEYKYLSVPGRKGR